MVGAYQDIMGDLHNLFGRVTEAHVFLDPDEESGWYIEEVIEGSTIGEVLAMTQWDKIELMRLLKTQVDAAIKTDFLKPSDAMKLGASAGMYGAATSQRCSQRCGKPACAGPASYDPTWYHRSTPTTGAA